MAEWKSSVVEGAFLVNYCANEGIKGCRELLTNLSLQIFTAGPLLESIRIDYHEAEADLSARWTDHWSVAAFEGTRHYCGQ